MKRSRINLFKLTSMTISVLGVLLIIGTILVFAYIGVDTISDAISGSVNRGRSTMNLQGFRATTLP
ncbi:hypothetical protein ACRERI_08725 [Methanothermobacter thermautotrophicus]|uniref:hypothetical protein n=1 Tax=Methanothermobacter thermautotrophicus TaxID=145262 RepID=UPI003D7F36C5